MNAVMRNSAIAAKISCMSSKLLTLEDYASMAELKNVSQVAAYLKNNTHYGAILDSVNESDVHREPLEILLKTTLVDDFEKLYCFADCSLKGFLDKILMFYEVEAIEHVAHSVYNKNCADEMLGEFLKRHIDVDLEILSSATTLDEFAESLGNTQYYKAFSSIVKSRGALSVFDIETALNIYCYTAVVKSIQNIPKEEQASIQAFYGTVVDIMNLKTLLRMKSSFKRESEYIYGCIIPYNYKLKKEEISALAGADDEKTLKELIASSAYGTLFKDDFYEMSIARYIYNMSKRFIRRYPYNYVSISSYFKIKETEIKNVFSVIEGIRYSLEPEKIMSYVVI